MARGSRHQVMMLSETTSILEDIRKRLDAGETSWAIQEIRTRMENGNATPDAHRLLAYAYLKDGAQEAAMNALLQSRSGGTSAPVELAFGRFLNSGGYKEAALDCFLSAASADPENDDALALICMHYAEASQPDRARIYGQKCLDARDRQTQNVQVVSRARPK